MECRKEQIAVNKLLMYFGASVYYFKVFDYFRYSTLDNRSFPFQFLETHNTKTFSNGSKDHTQNS